MKGLGIKYQLRLITLIPVFVIAIFFAFFYNYQFDQDLKQQITRLGQAYIRQLLPAAQLAMMRNDRRTLQGLINASTVNPDIMALAFYDAGGLIMAYRGGKHSIHSLFTPPAFTGDFIESKQINSTTINFMAPITLPQFNLYSRGAFKTVNKHLNPATNDILGWLSIDVNTQSTLIKRYQMYIVTIFITLIGLLISLTIHFFLSRRIYLPLNRLRRSLRQIQSNEFETQIKTTSSGEIGEIERGCVHMQQEYLSVVKDLNHHIEVATSDLQQSLELLEEKNVELSLEKKKSDEKGRQKSEFIANMSHEIRTPMNGVIGFTSVLLESKLDSLQLDYVKTIKTSAQDLLIIINDILDYSKIDAGKLRLDCIPVEIRACIDEVLMLAAPNAHKKGIDLIPSTEVNVPKTVLGDPLRIKQILTNLISNAIKFTDNGYVSIRTSIEVENEKNYCLRISVIDTGIGISVEDQNKLFNAFNQADTTITRRFGGTGLGLVICKKLAEAMYGKITLSSELHKGTTFTVTLRLEKLLAYEVEKNQAHRFSRLQVICFDDNPLHLEAMCNGIGFWGASSVAVNSFSQLEQAFIENPECQLALVNVNEGCEKQVAKIIRQQVIPCVIVSKWLVHNPESLGAKAFLFKPISVQKLYLTIESILEEASQSLLVSDELGKLRKQLSQLHPTILVAEDNPVNRMLLNSLLSDYSTIVMVNNGEEAVKACRIHHYDLLLLDLQMPKLNGLEAAQLIRDKSVLNKNTPIVVISANIDDIDQENLFRDGINLFLQKPIDEKELILNLVKLLSQKNGGFIDWNLCVEKANGNHLLAKDFLEQFVIELRSNKKDFIRLYHKKDTDGLEKAAHKLNGACCFCGVPRLQHWVITIETHAKSANNISEISSVFNEMLLAIDEVIQEYEQLYCASGCQN